jgi:translocation and assembly module TamB
MRTPDRIAVAARGDYGGRDIVMPRRAVLLKTADGGWALQKTQLGFGHGFMLSEGRFGGEQPAQGRLSLGRMPLSLLDVAGGDLGLGGTVSGIVDLGAGPNGVPTGEARVKVDNLTRSGPRAVVAPDRPRACRAAVAERAPGARGDAGRTAATEGRLQASITGLPASGALADSFTPAACSRSFATPGRPTRCGGLVAIDLIDITGTAQGRR